MWNKDHGNHLFLIKLTLFFQMPNPSLFPTSKCFLDVIIKKSMNLPSEGTYFQKIPKTLCNIHLTSLYMDYNATKCIFMRSDFKIWGFLLLILLHLKQITIQHLDHSHIVINLDLIPFFPSRNSNQFLLSPILEYQ